MSKIVYANKGTGNRLKTENDKYPTKEEFKALLAATQDGTGLGREAYDLFWFLGNFGLRISEALDLRKNDFAGMELAGGFNVRRKKKGRLYLDVLYVSDAERDALRGFLARRPDRIFPFCKRSAQYWFNHYARIAGILDHRPALSLHSLRHVCGMLSYAATKDPEFVRRRLGHAGLQHVIVYMHIDPEAQRETAAKREVIG